MHKLRRRTVLRGLGGAAVTLPLLEGLAPRQAKAAGDSTPPFVIFFRQANGVPAAQSYSLNGEQFEEEERFWPTQTGQLTAQTTSDRCLNELNDYLSNILVIGNHNGDWHDFGDGHANGAFQGLTARGPHVAGQGGASEASGESLDYRIGRELNPDGRDSLFMYAGSDGWLGGPCISHIGANNRHSAIKNPVQAYSLMMGIDSGDFEKIAARQQSVNDMVRDQMTSLMSNPQLSSNDMSRLDQHFQAIRDLENTLTCNLEADEEAMLDSPGFDSDNGEQVWQAVRAHMMVATLGVSCGFTRSVAIQVGSGNDTNRYMDPDTNNLMENYHYISHRLLSHGGGGDLLANAEVLHEKVTRQFAQQYAFLLDLLMATPALEGGALLDCGMAIWYNELGNGPGHSPKNAPWIIGGSAGGYLRQGEFIDIPGGDGPNNNHSQLLNTVGTAVGLRNENDGPLDNFGTGPGGIINEMLA